MVDGREGKPTEEHRPVAKFYYEWSFFKKPDGSFGRSAFTAFDGDRALGCAGMIFLPGGKGEVWMHLSEELAKKPLWLTKTATSKLLQVIIESGVQLVECFIPVENIVNREWVVWMGFKDLGPKVVRGEECRHYAIGGIKCLGLQQQHQQ